MTPEECVFNNQGQFKVRYSRRHEIIALAGFVLLCLYVGVSGTGFLLLNLHGWFLALRPPYGLPGPALFGAIAAMLYVLAGVAAWEVWRVPEAGVRQRHALLSWGWLMGLKALWTPVFFGLHWLLAAAGLGAVVGALALLTAVRFARLNRAAGGLMIVTAAWTGFELYLTVGFWWLNHG